MDTAPQIAGGATIGKLLKTVWPGIATDAARLVAWAVQNETARACLNVFYERLSARHKAAFYARFAKLFRHREARLASGRWRVRFRGHRIELPLDPETMWLDWDSALSALGHEPEIKSTYATLIDALPALDCVFDVGANYGLHSLLFLANGIPVVSFEPNPACRDYVERLEALNDVRFSVETIALDASNGHAELCFPNADVWLGTIDPEHVPDLSARFALERIEVTCETLDGYVERTGRMPGLIKIDTEGTELRVLSGARRTLERARPIVIFECWRDHDRSALWRYLNTLGYVIAVLPLTSLGAVAALDESEFSRDVGTNFAALPGERYTRA